MKTIKNRPVATASRAICFLLLGCAMLIPLQAADLSSADKDFMKDAAEGGLAEVTLAKLALSKAKRADVKMFAQQMIRDHSAANKQLQQVASSKNYKLPTGPGVKNDALKARLQVLSGQDFEEAYINSMVDDHKKDVEEFQKESADGTDSDVKSFASQTLPILKEHLNMITTIQGKPVTPK
jgi:putative membrane protein